MKIAALLAAVVLALLPASSGTVSVAYAGSLVRSMEGPLAQSLLAQTGLRFSGEPKGSQALAHLIAAGLRNPDVFISADPSLLGALMRQHLIDGYVVFGSARMVIAYSPQSPQRDLFEAVRRGQRSLLDVLANPAVRLGRTDPQLDPKGVRTVRAVQLLGRHFHAPAIAARILAKADVFPEEDLAVRVESGDLDAGFFYSIETPGRGLRAIELPPDANLSQDITFSLAVLRAAPHPRAARTFAHFVLHGAGRTTLENTGVHYFAHPQTAGSFDY